jgi:hypothetical protein
LYVCLSFNYYDSHVITFLIGCVAQRISLLAKFQNIDKFE